jgi:hypothetical protein
MPKYDEDLQWTRIDDFSPGIWSDTAFAKSGLGSTALLCPQGAAQETGTFNCIAKPNGLYPLPDTTTVGNTLTMSAITNPFLTGWSCIGQGGVAGDILVAGVADGAPGNYSFYAVNTNPNTTVKLLGPIAGGGDVDNQSCSLARTLCNNGAGTPALPVFVFCVPYVNAYMWPNPGGRGSNVPLTLTLSVTPAVLDIVHESRILVSSLDSPAYGTLGTVNYLEKFNVSDPLHSSAFAAGFNNFDQERPANPGAWGSISTSELLIVKQADGALQIDGDLINPSITKLPAVVPTGPLTQEACGAPDGLIYASANNGAWLWNGGNTSKKISENIRDDFHMMPGDIIMNYESISAWGEWIIFPNNWLRDSRLGGWWRLADPNVTLFSWSLPSVSDPTQMYLAPRRVVGVGVTTYPITFISKLLATSSYSWQSHPIQTSINRLLDVREVELTATNPNAGTATVILTVTAVDGTTQTATFTLPANMTQPSRVRTKVGLVGYNIVVKATTLNNVSSPAPIIHEIAIGYHDTHQAAAA